MQAGFALVETGFCRAKHAAHVVSTNFAIFGLGFVGFYLVGYGLMFGGYSVPLDRLQRRARRGRSSAAVSGCSCGRAASPSPTWSVRAAPAPRPLGFFLYMVAFMDTVATIPTGAMAERWKWNSFVGWGLFCGAIYYPLFGAWTWGGGWLSQLGNSMGLGYGYVDFAGSGVVHAVGGVAALAGRDRARPPHRQVQQGRLGQHAPGPPHPDGHARHASSCCSAGSASTPPRPSRRPTSSSPSWRRTPPSPAAFGAVTAMFYHAGQDRASPTPG